MGFSGEWRVCDGYGYVVCCVFTCSCKAVVVSDFVIDYIYLFMHL